MTSPANPKVQLRQELRESIPDAACQASQSAEICGALRKWLSSHPARTIACFAALPGEPMLLPLLALLSGRRWAFPRLKGNEMTFHFATHSTLRPGSYGILEPTPDSPTCGIKDIDLFLCPGMAFTTAGHRIGRGKGYYDRALEKASADSVRVGVSFREQLILSIPMDPHDQPMNFIASPDGVSACD